VGGVQPLVGEDLLGGGEDRLRRGLTDALSEGGLYTWFHKMNRDSVFER